MTAQELRTKYLKFFESKGHTIIPSASLIPENDPSTLFTGSGMQPMVPYLLGEKHPLGTRITDSQKCFRTQDIEEIGDNRHTTVFEMLGNWSLGDYFKKEQIAWMFEFLTKEVGLNPEQLFITVFRGNEKLGIERDVDAVNLWKEEFKKVGIDAKDVDFSEKDGMGNGRIFYYDEKKNWWSRAGVPDNMPVGEPGGPDSEMFWDFGAELKMHENSEYKNEQCHVNCDCGRFLEIGNNVFMQYVKTKDGFESLPKGNIDFGGGLERLAAAKKNTPDIFLTELFIPIITKLEKISCKKYEENEEIRRSFRVIADHLKASTFLISDGAIPSNTERGYFLRRLIRRAIRYGKMIGIENNFTVEIAKVAIDMYKDFYPEVENNKEAVFAELEKEENKFRITLLAGIKMYRKYILNLNIRIPVERDNSTYFMINPGDETAQMVFDLYQTYGFPIEMVFEEIDQGGIMFEKNDKKIIESKFNNLLKKHQELSKTASAGMFKGGLADTGEETKKLHTAAHLMLASLRKVLGEHVTQKGSNITPERLRFDFSHGEKMTLEQIKQVEYLVNEAIGQKLDVNCDEMTLEEAKAQNAMGVFEVKYGEKVKVYTAGDFSREICGGPHVKNTSELGHFKIQKEESSSAGVRRIKAILQ